MILGVDVLAQTGAVPRLSTTLLAIMVGFGVFAVVARSVSWLRAASIDTLLLGIVFVVGWGGFVFTFETGLLFGPPAIASVWLLVGQYAGAGPGGRTPRRRSGESGSGQPRRGRSPGGEDAEASLAERLDTDPPGHDFADVGGMDDLLETIDDRVIQPLSNPGVYEEYGIGAVNGVLFHGPPGCGKTFVASAVAGETDYNYVEITPTDITSKYIGEAADNVADVFDLAREHDPCLLFIDEIDAVATERSGHMAASEQQMVNQLLTELESQADSEVVVFAATNYLEDVDDAILRSGRFDERIEVPPPDRSARREMLALELAETPTADDVDFDAIAAATAGYASSDVTLLADVAARHAIAEREPVHQAHLRQALDEVETSLHGWLDRYRDRFDEDLAGFGATDEPVSFAELPGMAATAAAIEARVLDPVRDPERYDSFGVDGVGGALLYGPPDCGKTTAARSIAAELDRDLVELAPDRLRREDVSDPADRAEAVVETARDGEPAVLLIDRLDDLAPAAGGARSRKRLADRLATLLPTLDPDDALVVGTATIVDDVHVDVLHCGVFDERVEVPPPNADTRIAVLDDVLPDAVVDSSIDLEAVAAATEGCTLRDLRYLGGRVAREALREEAYVTAETLVEAADEIESSLDSWDDRQRYADGDFGSLSDPFVRGPLE